LLTRRAADIVMHSSRVVPISNHIHKVDIVENILRIVESLVNPPWFDCLYKVIILFFCHLVCTRERREDLFVID
jgi:hypothetical protein